MAQAVLLVLLSVATSCWAVCPTFFFSPATIPTGPSGSFSLHIQVHPAAITTFCVSSPITTSQSSVNGSGTVTVALNSFVGLSELRVTVLHGECNSVTRIPLFSDPPTATAAGFGDCSNLRTSVIPHVGTNVATTVFFRSVEVSCGPGYRLDGGACFVATPGGPTTPPPTTTTTSPPTTTTTPPPTTIPPTTAPHCSAPTPPSNGSLSSCGGNIGDTCQMVCNPGYVPAGSVRTCQANATWSGSWSCTLPQSCKEVKQIPGASSGVYTIRPINLGGSAVSVYCDMTYDNGAGWTRAALIFTNDFRTGGSTFLQNLWTTPKGNTTHMAVAPMPSPGTNVGPSAWFALNSFVPAGSNGGDLVFHFKVNGDMNSATQRIFRELSQNVWDSDSSQQGPLLDSGHEMRTEGSSTWTACAGESRRNDATHYLAVGTTNVAGGCSTYGTGAQAGLLFHDSGLYGLGGAYNPANGHVEIYVL
mmetsp:Transcript_28954/g.67039  ORF Transcript_28954/g.67039 Transcript_28954/m.67039 type:complete len:474 (+) Transcript_28954:17-1438(+)